MALKHIAIIMDGNRRWAKKNGLPSYQGHKSGVENLYNTIENAINNNIKYLTVFGFSTENWNRSKKEVTYLLHLFDDFLDEALKKIEKKNVKVRFIGDLSKFSSKIQSKIESISIITKNNSGIVFTLAVNYGGRFDIVQAANRLIMLNNNSKIDEQTFSKLLMNYEVPNPDLLIRTGGEKRISNFMLWDLAYTELIFLKEMWPDFDRSLLKFSINKYNKRIRNFGGNN